MESQARSQYLEIPFIPTPSGSDASVLTTKQTKCPKRKRRHIPHSERPYDFVKRRNLREKRRIDNLNAALEFLRRCVPSTRNNHSESKINILRQATEYISYLNHILSETDHVLDTSVEVRSSTISKLHKYTDFKEQQGYEEPDVFQSHHLENSFPLVLSEHQDIWADGTIFRRDGLCSPSTSPLEITPFLNIEKTVPHCFSSHSQSFCFSCASDIL